MTERVKEILTQIRRNINEISEDKIRNSELWGKCNRIQKDIMLRTYCLEKPFTADFDGTDTNYNSTAGTYDISGENILKLEKWFPSWEETLLWKENHEWDRYTGATGSHPVYFTMFGRTLYFSPVPSSASDSILFWGFQTGVDDPIDNTHDPELPDFCDEAIISGVSAQYDKSFKDDYLRQINLILSLVHHKSSDNQKQSNW